MNELDLVKKESRNFDENDELMVVCNREPKCISVNKSDENVLILLRVLFFPLAITA